MPEPSSTRAIPPTGDRAGKSDSLTVSGRPLLGPVEEPQAASNAPRATRVLCATKARRSILAQPGQLEPVLSGVSGMERFLAAGVLEGVRRLAGQETPPG